VRLVIARGEPAASRPQVVLSPARPGLVWLPPIRPLGRAFMASVCQRQECLALAVSLLGDRADGLRLAPTEGPFQRVGTDRPPHSNLPEIGVDELIFDCRVPSVAARSNTVIWGDDPRYAYIHAYVAGVSEIEEFYMSMLDELYDQSEAETTRV
jgi:hypothetical protein